MDPLGEVRILEGQPPPGRPAHGAYGTIRGPRSRGDVVKWLNTEVCKTSIHRFESGRRLQILSTKPVKHHLANARSKVAAETTAQLVWILAPRLPEAEDMPEPAGYRSRP